jgi:hypothetical protein
MVGLELRAGGHQCPQRIAVVIAGQGQPVGGGQDVERDWRGRRFVVVVAPGQAARTAASTAPGGTVPGTQRDMGRRRPVQVYCHTTCGLP